MPRTLRHLPSVAVLSLVLLSPPSAARVDEIPVDLLLNGDFEMTADSTTEPVKRGAYWKGAFSTREGDPTDLVVEEEGGNHALRITDEDGEVSQIATAYGPHADRLLVTLRARASSPGSTLALRFTTQEGRSIELALLGEERPGEDTGDGWCAFRLPIGGLVAERTGAPPGPWCRLALRAAGEVLVDDVVLRHVLPRVEPRALRDELMRDVRASLRVHLLSPDGDQADGLELVDPETGYLTGTRWDVRTGEVRDRVSVVGIAGVHELMLHYLQAGDDDPAAAPLVALVRDRLKKHLISILKNNVFRPTGLYCLYDLERDRQLLQQELVPAHFIRYAYEVAALFPEEEKIRTYVDVICREMADRMVRLRDEHDLPDDVKFGRGPGGNWFGRMPEKVSPKGVLAEPKKSTYDQAWAISQDRSWYHDFDTLLGLMHVHAASPKPEYAAAVEHVIRRFDREWDAARYDLENDTDDHYGKNVEAALQAWVASGYAFDALRDFAQAATDHRLSRDVPWHDGVWIEGNRLGSFTTGDQPRAYRGPIGLYLAPEEQNPATSGFTPYRHALRELVKSDLKRRILDDGWMTEASCLQWEMIAACFDGDYIGPCTEDREWEGDMGDQFAGPAANGFRAIGRTLEICRPGRDLELLAWYALVHRHTVERYRHPFGYAYGLPEETGRRYGLRDRDLQGFVYDVPYGFAAVLVHSETLASLDLDRDAARVSVAGVTRTPAGVAVEVTGPPGREVDVAVADRERFSHVGVTDWRLRSAAPERARTVRVRLDDEGAARAEVGAFGSAPEVFVDALLRLDDEEVEDVATGRFALDG